MIPQGQLLKHLIVHHRQYSFYAITVIGVQLIWIRPEYQGRIDAHSVI